MDNDKGLMANLKYDIPAGIVVFLVAVPLCLGIALASGAPLFSGLIAGIVGGIIVGMLSGSSIGVSGPAAGLIGIVLPAITEYGLPIFLSAVVLSGVIQLIFGYARAGIIAYYFPGSVIKGMLAGIGVIIISKQIPHALGYDKDPEGDLSFMQPDGQSTASEFVNMLDFITPGAVIITLVSLAILILWGTPFIKRFSFTQLVQGPLVAVIVGVILTMAFQSSPTLALDQEHLVSIPIATTIDEFKGLFIFPDFSQVFSPSILLIAAILALVASLETLLCVEATDKLDPRKNITPTNRELKAQGVGNIISGLLGGLPVTQVIVRSSTNIQSGGRTKVSAIFHGLLIVICVFTIPQILNKIPLACLAAILLVVGYKLAKPVLFKEMWAKGFREFIPFIVTIVFMYFTSLLIGIAIGMAVAIFFILERNFVTPFFLKDGSYKDDKVHLQLSENVTFLNKGGIMRSLSSLPDHSKVVIDASRSVYVHPDVLEIIHDFEHNAKERGIELELVGVDDTPHARASVDLNAAMAKAPKAPTSETKVSS